MLRTTDLADVYIALINLGMADIDLRIASSKLMESCANMSNLSPKATKE